MSNSTEEDYKSWARLMIRAYGPNAAVEARKLAYESKLSGDRAGAAKWTRVSDLAARGAAGDLR